MKVFQFILIIVVAFLEGLVLTSIEIPILKHRQFGQFIRGLYDNLNSNRGVFRLFNQKKERWASNPVKYHQWYIDTVDNLYHAFLDGADWDEISRLSVKE